MKIMPKDIHQVNIVGECIIKIQEELINGYKPKDEHSKVEFIKMNAPMTKLEYADSLKATAVAGA